MLLKNQMFEHMKVRNDNFLHRSNVLEDVVSLPLGDFFKESGALQLLPRDTSFSMMGSGKSLPMALSFVKAVYTGLQSSPNRASSSSKVESMTEKYSCFVSDVIAVSSLLWPTVVVAA